MLYDGVCALCNRAVRLILRFDHRKRLRFAPLGGQTAIGLMPIGVGDADSIVLLREGRVFMRSAAVLEILFEMGGIWRASVVFRIVPRRVLDALYDFVAARRYASFGRYDTCPVPEPAVRPRFLP
ncbi:MAG: thiol-disulfide oxidoreductase DCC family protein [Gemmatimonadota bacterium]